MQVQVPYTVQVPGTVCTVDISLHVLQLYVCIYANVIFEMRAWTLDRAFDKDMF